MRDIMQQRGSEPVAWRVVSNSLAGWEWIVFANAENMPGGTHGNPAHSRLDITLSEAV